MAAYTWNNSGGGNFGSGIAWSPGGTHPVAGDTADLTNAFAGVDYTVAVTDAEAAEIVNIGVGNAALFIAAGGVLTAGTINAIAGTLNVGGEITGATVNFNNNATFLPQDGTLDNVTWKGTLALAALGVSNILAITTGLSVLNAAGNGPGEIDITGLGAELNVESSMTLNGTGGNLLINIGGLGGAGNNEYLSVGSNDILTFGTAVTLSQTSAGSNVRLNDVSTLGTIINNGMLSFTAGAGSSALINVQDFTNNGTIIAQGGILNGESLDITTFNTFTLGTAGQIFISDFGRVGITGTVAAGGVDISGHIAVTGQSTLDLNTDAVGSGTIHLSNHSTADIFNFLGTVAFLDATDVLALEQPANFTGTVVGMIRTGPGTHDIIDLLHTQADSIVPYVGDAYGGTLTVMSGGSPVANIQLMGNYVGMDFELASDGNGGTDIFIGCFTAGTRILTVRGEVAVEALREGDLAVALSGQGMACRPVRWIGRSRIDVDRHPTPQTVSPIRIRAGAFGEGLPLRDLLLSPDHGVFADGVLIPVHHLVNGATVSRESVRGTIAYYHVELDAHAVLLAEGLPAESYFDTGNRGDFENGGGPRTLHPTFRAQAWDERACAPLVTQGERLTAVRARLAERAAQMGFATTSDPGLAIIADGVSVAVERTGPHAWRATLPPGTRAVRLASRSFIPDERNPGAGDARRLGVPLQALWLDGVPVLLDDAALAQGFHAVENGAWRWTDGDALVRTVPAQARMLELELLALECPYWAEPEPPGVPTQRQAER